MHSPEGLEDTPFPTKTHEMDKLTVVLMSIKRLNKERRPLALKFFKCAQEQYFLRYLYEIKSMTNFYFYAFLFQLANC